MSRLCAITGANGFIGSLVNEYLIERGYRTIKLVRRPADNSSVYFDLAEDLDAAIFRGVDVLLHCAYDLRPRKWAEIHQVNVIGSQNLFQSARQSGVGKIILISTVSAFESCKSLYGKAKLEIEKAVAGEGVVIVRPGLVYSNQQRGLFGSLNKIAKFPLLPVFDGGGQPFVLVHAEDLARLIERIIAYEKNLPSLPIVAAHPRYVSFRELLKMLAKRHGHNASFVSVPGQLAWFMLSTLEFLGVNVEFRSDSLMSMLNPNCGHDFSGSECFGVTYQRFSEWCAAS